MPEGESTWQQILESAPVGSWQTIAQDSQREHKSQTTFADYLVIPQVLLYCGHELCDKRMIHECGRKVYVSRDAGHYAIVQFRCRQCSSEYAFALLIRPTGEGFVEHWEVKKFGQLPPPHNRVPNNVLRLLPNQDQHLLTKGFQCERLGYGIGAFAYYRLVVESTSMRVNLLGEVKKVCETDEQRRIIDTALSEPRFYDSIRIAEDALPRSLFIGDENPLALLYSVLSDHLHAGADDTQCLEHGKFALLMITRLMALIQEKKQFERETREAFSRLKALKKGVTSDAQSQEEGGAESAPETPTDPQSRVPNGQATPGHGAQ